MIFISIIKAAFFSFKDHPASLFEDDMEGKPRSKSSNAIAVFHPPQSESLKSKLESNFHAELRSHRAFKHLVQNGLSTPFMTDEIEENTQEIINEMEEIADEVVELLYNLKTKAVEEKEDEKAVSRLRELVTAELPLLFQNLEDALL